MALPAKKKPLKLPKSMGACADLLFETRERRLAAKAAMEAIEADEKAIKEHIINNLPKGDTGASGKHHRVTVVTKDVPQVKDWDKFYAYVAKNKAFDLLQRRLSDVAVKDRLDAGKKVAGVETFTAVSVSLQKVK